MREIKSISGLRVISVDEGANVGLVNQVVVDLAQGMMLGLIIGDGMPRGVLASDIQTIGSDVIMISRSDLARPLGEVPELEKRKSASAHLVPVFTDSGRRLGVVSSIFIDPYEKTVTHYEISSGAIKDLADGLLVMPIIEGTVHGVDAVILPDQAVQDVGRETGGLFARFSQWGDSARKQYQQVADSAGKIVETGSETLKKETAVVRERAGELTEKAKEVSDIVGERAKVVTQKAREVGEMVGEKASEVGAKAKGAVSRLGDEDDRQPDAVAVVPVPEDNPAAEQLVAAPEHDPSAEQIIEAPEHNPAAEQIVPSDDATAEETAEEGCCGCTEEKPGEA
jgi:uncharacterized protein YrrD